MAKSVETWMDALCKTFNISDGGLGSVRSFLVFERNELPNAVSAEMAPCAVSYVTDMQVEYSTGGPTIFYWYGETDFHLTKDVKIANVSSIMKYYGRIFSAAAGNMQLDGLVEHFTILQNTSGAMQFVTFKHPVTGQDDHQGIIVKWFVKQNVSGEYTISA
jgi:hypothetical protein